MTPLSGVRRFAHFVFFRQVNNAIGFPCPCVTVHEANEWKKKRSLLLLVSVLRTEKCTNKTCAGWILCFAGYYVPLLGHLVTWIGRCRGMKSFTIGMSEGNFSARHGLKTWSVVCLEQYWKFANYVSTLPRERWVVRALNALPEHARRLAALLTVGTQWFNLFAGTNK